MSSPTAWTDGMADDTTTLTITIDGANDAPEVDQGIANTSATEDMGFTYSVPNNAFSDIDMGDSLTFKAQVEQGGSFVDLAPMPSASPVWLTFDSTTEQFGGTPRNTDVGMTLTVRVIATDTGTPKLTTHDDFTITVGNTNDAPEVDQGIADTSATEDSPFSYPVPDDAFRDIDTGDSLTFKAQVEQGGSFVDLAPMPSASPVWLTFDSTTEQFGGTPRNEDVGVTLTVRVIATDSGGLTTHDDFTITVDNTNDRPTAVLDENRTGEDVTLDVPASGVLDNDTDPDPGGKASLSVNGYSKGSALAASPTPVGTAVAGDWGELLLNADGGYTYTPGDAADAIPEGDSNEMDVFTYRVTDGMADDTTTLTITIEGANDAPEVDQGIDNTDATEDMGFTYSVPNNAFSDIDMGDTPTLTAQVEQGGSFVDLAPMPSASPVWLTFDGSLNTEQFGGTPRNDDVGMTLTVRVTATDSGTPGLTAVDDFTITVDNANDAPVLAEVSGADQMVSEAGGVANATTGDPAAGGSFTLSDVDASPMLTIQGRAGTSGNAWMDGSDTANGNKGTLLPGTYGNFYLKAASDSGGSITATWTYQLDDDDPDTQQLAPVSTNIRDSFTFRIDDNTADMTTRYSNTITLSIAITGANDAPEVDQGIGDTSIDEDMAFIYPVPGNAFRDLDAGDTLTLTAQVQQLSGTYTDLSSVWLTFDGSREQFGGTPRNDDVGTMAVRVIATDGDLTTHDDFTITVNDTNDDPQLVGTGLTDRSTHEDEVFIYDTAPAFTDQDMDPLQWDARMRPTSGELIDIPNWLNMSSAGELKGEPGNDDVGTMTIRIIVSDGRGGSIHDDFELEVLNVNDQPVLTEASGADTRVTETGLFTPGDLDASGSFIYADVDQNDRGFGDGGSIEGRGSLAGIATNAVWVAGSSAGDGTRIPGTYGNLSLKDDGTWTYRLDDDDPDTEALDAGETAMDTFVFRIDDGDTETAARYSEELSISIMVQGASDVASPEKPIVEMASVNATDADVIFTLERTGGGPSIGIGVMLLVVSPAGYVNAGPAMATLGAGSDTATLTLPRNQEVISESGDVITATIQPADSSNAGGQGAGGSARSYEVGSRASLSVMLIDLKPAFEVAELVAGRRDLTVRFRRIGSNSATARLRAEVTSQSNFVQAGTQEILFAESDNEKTLTLPLQRRFGVADVITVRLLPDPAYLVSPAKGSSSLSIEDPARAVRNSHVNLAASGVARSMGWDLVETISSRSGKAGTDQPADLDGLTTYLNSRYGGNSINSNGENEIMAIIDLLNDRRVDGTDLGSHGISFGKHGVSIQGASHLANVQAGSASTDDPHSEPGDSQTGWASDGVIVWADGKLSNLSFGDTEDISHEGDMHTLRLGVEKNLRDDLDALTIGIATGTYRGKIDFNNTQYDVKGQTDLSGWHLSPYLVWDADSAKVWVTLGAGQGKLDYAENASVQAVSLASDSSDISMYTLASGVDYSLASRGLVEFLGRYEAMLVSLKVSDGKKDVFDEQKVEAYGLRGELEVGWRMQPDASTTRVRPYLTLGYRWDDGDGSAGDAFEFGAGVSVQTGHLTFEGSALTQGSADRGELDRSSYSLEFNYDSNNDRHGLMLNVSRDQGGGRMDTFAQQMVYVGEPVFIGSETINIEAGYGLGLEAGLLTISAATGIMRGERGEVRLSLVLDRAFRLSRVAGVHGAFSANGRAFSASGRAFSANGSASTDSLPSAAISTAAIWELQYTQTPGSFLSEPDHAIKLIVTKGF